MKTTKLILNLVLLLALPVAADNSTLRYTLSGELELSLEQEIYAGDGKKAIAGRYFGMTFGFRESMDMKTPVELMAIRANYNAHGMKQRLPAAHLAGKSFALDGDGRSFESNEIGPEVNVGQITDGNFLPAEALVQLLPILPEGPIDVGSVWETTRSIRSLEGWSWAGGELSRRHEVTDIDESNGTRIISVASRGEATLSAAEGHEGYGGEGKLQQSIEWSFDAANGQLLSLKGEQEVDGGTSHVPQGDVPVRQITRFDIS